MSAGQRVVIREVGTRDGIQSIGAAIPTRDKIELIEGLADAGLVRVEATSFVNPRAVPQMADAAQVMAGLRRRPGVLYEALVPNARGARDALAAGVDALITVVTASETFNQKNVRMSVDDSFRQFEEVRALAVAAGVRCVGTVGTAFGCPYEGEVTEDRLIDLVGRYHEGLGLDEVIVADTTGMANPGQVETTMRRIVERWPELIVGLHFHNTRGMGLANVIAGLRVGVMQYDASVAGIGGCPFAPEAAGNISTEDTVHMLHEMGYATGVDVERLIAVARRAQEILGRELPGQVMKAGPRWRRHAA